MANWLVLSKSTNASLAYSVLATGSHFYENQRLQTLNRRGSRGKCGNTVEKRKKNVPLPEMVANLENLSKQNPSLISPVSLLWN